MWPEQGFTVSVDLLHPCAHAAHVTENWDCERWGRVMSTFCFSSIGQDPEALRAEDKGGHGYELHYPKEERIPEPQVSSPWVCRVS